MDKVNQVLSMMRKMSAGELATLADRLGIDPKSLKGFYLSTLSSSLQKVYNSNMEAAKNTNAE